MRPAGEVRQALLQACQALATPDRGATLQELAARACVGLDAAATTVKNMRRAKVLGVPRMRSVAYRNKPVAEYVPLQLMPAANDPVAGLAHVLTAWVG